MHLKHSFFLHCEESQNAFTCPFCGSQNEGPASFKWRSGGAGLLQMDQLWGYSSKGRNWEFSTWVKIVLQIIFDLRYIKKQDILILYMIFNIVYDLWIKS